MPIHADNADLRRRINDAMDADDGPAMFLAAQELAKIAKSKIARSNRTNKKKSVDKALADWRAKTGVDLQKLTALAAMLRASAGDGSLKWKTSVECALMVLRPDLSHRRGIFRPGSPVPSRLRRPTVHQARLKLDEERGMIIRTLAERRRYQEGALGGYIATIEEGAGCVGALLVPAAI